MLQAAAAEAEAAKHAARAVHDGKDAEIAAIQRTVAQLQGELASEREQSATHLRTVTSLQESLMQVTQERAALHMQLAQQSQRVLPTSSAAAADNAAGVAASSLPESGNVAIMAEELAAAVLADIQGRVEAGVAEDTSAPDCAAVKRDAVASSAANCAADDTTALAASDPSVCNVTDETVVVQPVASAAAAVAAPPERAAVEETPADTVSGHKRKRELTPERVAQAAAGDVGDASLDLTTDDELELE